MAESELDPGDSLPPQLARLPSGRHGLPREFIAANHRDRLVAACVQEVSERGYPNTTVAHIIKAAAVSRRTFYEYFDSKEACFLATYDLIVAHVRARTQATFEAEEGWQEGVRAVLAFVLRFFAEEPRLGRICLVEPLAAGPPVSEHHRQVIEGFTPVLAATRDPNRPEDPPPGTEKAVIAGIVTLITRRLILDQADQLEELLPDVLEAGLAPFLGAAEAERISRQAS